MPYGQSHDPLTWALEQIAIEITLFCNLTCKMCSVWEGKIHGPSSDLIRDLLGQARDLGAGSFLPCGGEPFMRPDFLDLLQHAAAVGYERAEVVTNGMLVPRHLDRLQALQPLVRLHVSIDGPEAVHDPLRGAGVYHQAVEAVRQCRRRGITVGISGVLMRPTLGSWEHVVDLAARLGLEEVSFQPFQPEIDGYERDHSPWTFSLDQRGEVEAALVRLRRHAREAGVRIYTESILDHVPAYLFDGVRPIPAQGCFMPSRFVLVDAHGDVFPCFFMREEVMGNVVRQDRLDQLWHGAAHEGLQLQALERRCPGCLAACSDIATFEGRR